MVKKIVKKKDDQNVDAKAVEVVIEELRNSDQGEVSEQLKEKLMNYLELMRKLLGDIEHSKISISKLQKLFGFYEEEVKSKEV